MGRHKSPDPKKAVTVRFSGADLRLIGRHRKRLLGDGSTNKELRGEALRLLLYEASPEDWLTDQQQDERDRRGRLEPVVKTPVDHRQLSRRLVVMLERLIDVINAIVETAKRREKEADLTRILMVLSAAAKLINEAHGHVAPKLRAIRSARSK